MTIIRRRLHGSGRAGSVVFSRLSSSPSESSKYARSFFGEHLAEPGDLVHLQDVKNDGLSSKDCRVHDALTELRPPTTTIELELPSIKSPACVTTRICGIHGTWVAFSTGEKPGPLPRLGQTHREVGTQSHGSGVGLTAGLLRRTGRMASLGLAGGLQSAQGGPP